MNFHVI